MILYMGIVLYAPALALEAVTGISKTNSVLIIGKQKNIFFIIIDIVLYLKCSSIHS